MHIAKHTISKREMFTIQINLAYLGNKVYSSNFSGSRMHCNVCLLVKLQLAKIF